MKEYNLKLEPLTFITIRSLSVNCQINEHGTAIVEGYISDDDEGSYLKLLMGNVWEKIEEVGKDGDLKTLFWGLVTSFSIEKEHDQKRMTLELTTGTYLMDLVPHFRTFQNPSVTYAQIFKQLLETYEDSGLIKNIPLSEPTGSLIMQYRETDWEFLKRMAGIYHSFLVPSTTVKGTKFFIDLPKGEKYELAETVRCSVAKDLGEYIKKRLNGLTQLREAACLEYVVESREDYRIGDQLTIYGQTMYAYRIESRLEAGEMLHKCYLRSGNGLDTTEIIHEDRTGCSFMAEILQVKADKVQVRVRYDENQEQEINLWYPYSTVYSTPDGTGWYCMPEVGDSVRLHIPMSREDSAYVVSSVHLETESTDRKNPEHKIIKNKYQKEIRFTPDSIVLTNNQGTRITLTDKNGVQIVSEHSIVIKAKDNLTISSENGSLTAAGTTSVNLKQRTTSIDIDNGISFTGGELKVQ